MYRLLRYFLGRLITSGTLRVVLPDGTTFTVGDGAGQPVAIRFTSPAAVRAVLRDPELALGETYMDATLEVVDGRIADLLALLLAQNRRGRPPPWGRLQRWLRRLKRRLSQLNLRRRARRNVARHYDLDGRLYAMFLDSDRQYSCAYFETPGQSLDDAQLAKKRHIAAKLLVPDGARMLDIGSGWGGMALYLAETCGAHVTGITLSQEQCAYARASAAERGLDGRATFRLEDYRDVGGRYDRIVSVGMFEHVGVGFYDTFFARCADLLADDGVMLLHAIGRSEGPGATNPWVTKYIFPGGYVPALSEVLPAIERAGLLATDIEILRLHYAETLAAWRARFDARREEAERLYDGRFARMWEFYLAAAEMAFRHQGMMVFQIQLTKRQGVVPATRDYIARETARLRDREGGGRPPLRLAGE